MIVEIHVLLMSLIIITAMLALYVKDLVVAAVLLGGYSFLMCILWSEMNAIDVGFTEAAVGAGVSTVYILAMVMRTGKESRD